MKTDSQKQLRSKSLIIHNVVKICGTLFWSLEVNFVFLGAG